MIRHRNNSSPRIALCTVVIKNSHQLIPYLEKTIEKFTSNITEVLIAYVMEEDFVEGQEEWFVSGIKFKLFNVQTQPGFGHPTGLHACLDKVNSEYVLFCDPDVFFSDRIDEFYLQMMEKYDLDVIGVSHYTIPAQSMGVFPCVFNMLVKKDKLPNKDFLKGYLKWAVGVLFGSDYNAENWNNFQAADGYYLAFGPIPEIKSQYPKPDMLFDIGCNLWFHAQEQNWRWMAFQTPNGHWYDTSLYQTNFGLTEQLCETKTLLYHHVAGARACLFISDADEHRKKLFHEEFVKIHGEL